MNYEGQDNTTQPQHQESNNNSAVHNCGCLSQQLSQLTEIDSTPLIQKQLNLQRQFDRELIIRNLDQNEPTLQNRQLQAHKQLKLNPYDHHQHFDKELILPNLSQKQPHLYNTLLQAHKPLPNTQLNKQAQYDKHSLMQDIDIKQPDIIEIKRKDDQKIEVARGRARERDLVVVKEQERVSIRSVKDYYVEARVFQNQGVFPLENCYDFQEGDSTVQIQVPLGNKKGSNVNPIRNTTNKIDKFQVNRQKSMESDDQDWQANICPTYFSISSIKNSNVAITKNEDNIEKNAQTQSKDSFTGYNSTNTHKNYTVNSFQDNPLVKYAMKMQYKGYQI